MGGLELASTNWLPACWAPFCASRCPNVALAAPGREGWTVITPHGEAPMLAPAEGEIVAVNQKAISNPELISQDPYGSGWLLEIFSPDTQVSFRNCSRAAWRVAGWSSPSSSCGRPLRPWPRRPPWTADGSRRNWATNCLRNRGVS